MKKIFLIMVLFSVRPAQGHDLDRFSLVELTARLIRMGHALVGAQNGAEKQLQQMNAEALLTETEKRLRTATVLAGLNDPISNPLEMFLRDIGQQPKDSLREKFGSLISLLLDRGAEITPKRFELAIRSATPVEQVKKMIDKHPEYVHLKLGEKNAIPFFYAVLELPYQAKLGNGDAQAQIAKLLLDRGSDSNPQIFLGPLGKEVPLFDYVLFRGDRVAAQFLLDNHVPVEEATLTFGHKVQQDCLNQETTPGQILPQHCQQEKMNERLKLLDTLKEHLVKVSK